MFHPGELPLVLLAILHERPRSGYGLVGALRERISDYQPSTGSIYPAIAALQQEGLVEVDASFGRGALRITPEGLDVLTAKRPMLRGIEARLGAALNAPDQLDGVLERFMRRISAHGNRLEVAQIERVLEQAATTIERLGTNHG